MNMKEDKRRRMTRDRLIRIAVLLAVGWAIRGIILLFWGDMVGHHICGGGFISFLPVYNTKGSWFHALFGVGYNRAWMLFEHTIALVVLLALFRFLEYTCEYFGIERIWLVFYDFGVAATASRILSTAAGTFTLDYLGIGRHIYDFFDFCIGAAVVSMLIWYVRLMMKYYPYKKRCTKGMRFGERLRWELKFGFQMYSAMWTPRSKWKSMEEM